MCCIEIVLFRYEGCCFYMWRVDSSVILVGWLMYFFYVLVNVVLCKKKIKLFHLDMVS